jgi:ribose transport system permease protein
MQGDVRMMIPASMLVLAVAALVGFTNGLLVTKLRVNALIATLGVGLMLQGILSASFSDFAGSVPASYQALAYGKIGPLPVSVLFPFALAAIGWAVLTHTRYGAHVYATGGNPEAARLAGIKTGWVIVSTHALCSIAAAAAGLYLASRLRSGAPWIGRDGVYDLESIAVAVVGGTPLAGGRGGVWGTMAGVILFSCLDAIFTMAGINSFMKQVLRGIIVIAAVAAYTRRGRERSA